MNRKSVFCVIVVLIAFTFSSQLSRAAILPGENPHLFRNQLHRDYTRIGPAETDFAPETVSAAGAWSEKAAIGFEVLISESVSPANYTQSQAALAALSGGRTAVVWEDDRQGPTACFLQLFDGDGNILGTNQVVASRLDSKVIDPHICPDNNGNFYLIWREDISGLLKAIRLDSLAEPVSSVFFISDTSASSYAGEYDADCLSDGRLVVVWEDYSTENNIAFQLFTPAGVPSTVKDLANSDGLDVRHWSPKVAANNVGGFAIVWEDYRDGSADIFFRRFNTLGLPADPEFSLADGGAPDSGRFLPSLTYSSTDGYTAAWVDLRNKQNIYMQRVTTTGAKTGNNIWLTFATADFPNWEIDLGVNSVGNLLAVWTLYAIDKSIMLQKFSPGVQFDGAPQAVSDVNENLKYDPVVSGNFYGNTVVSWTDESTGLGDIDIAFLAANGDEILPISTVNDDISGSPSLEPQVTHFDQFEWSIVFTDRRRDAGDIMLQRLYVGGDRIDNNRLINSDPPGGLQSQPHAASNRERLLISWTDERQGTINGQNIFCKFSRPSYSVTDDIVVNDDYAGSSAHYNSECAIKTDGYSLVAWTDTRTGVPHIYGQIFDQDYEKIGSNFLIGPAAPTETGEMAAVSIDGDGAFIVGYLNRRNIGGPSVEFKRINNSGSVTALFEFASDQNGFDIDGFDGKASNNNQVVLAWHAINAGLSELYLTAFDYSGTVVSSTQVIPDDAEYSPGLPDLSIDETGHSLITWLHSNAQDTEPFAKYFASDFNPIAPSQPVSSVYGNEMQFVMAPATATYRGKGVFVWSDSREDGLQVYASQELYDPTDVDDDASPMPASFDLEQNFPNPFNPSTVIRFSLPRSGHIGLAVFNLLGQKIRTLADRDYPAGNHSATWDGKDDNGLTVASGIYLYRIESGDQVQARKMTLLK